MPGFIGMPELLLLGLVALLVFGPKRLPEMGRSLGRGMREFKDSVTNNDSKTDDPFAIPSDDDEAAAPVLASAEGRKVAEAPLAAPTLSARGSSARASELTGRPAAGSSARQ
ncbi:MAG: twin-arginine translocase TatA/TatE family subunit [Actinomycetota bacterium]|nr:twin-arginine translocase TatA/TatE family subunit [Actinomycetota bacterium]